VPQDKDVVVVCRSGNRSQQGRDILVQAGFTRVTSMAGGVTDWRSQGLPVE
jgi:rhodanese-related sulfurtransferase